MASAEETVILELALSESVYPLVQGELDPELFHDRGFRALIRLLQDSPDLIEQGGAPPSPHLVVPSLSARDPELSPESVDSIRETLDSAARLNGDIPPDQGSKAVLKFLKQRMLIKAAHLVSGSDFRRAELLFNRASAVVGSSERLVDPSDAETLRELQEKELPDGRISAIRSSSTVVNQNLSFGGYKIGDLVMVCGAPKVGKSTFMAQEGTEALRQGVRVLHFAIGDMSEYDVVTKYLSCLSGDPIGQIIRSPEAFREQFKIPLSLLRIKSVPALSVGVNELAALSRSFHRSFPFDLVIVDYDANISSRNDSLYEAGGMLYSTLKGLGESLRCVVIVGSQPKQSAWEDEPLSGASAAESSRKQQAVDIMLTLARNKKNPVVGTLSMPLVRRGVSDRKVRIRFEYDRSRIVELDPDDYDQAVRDGASLSGP